MNRNHGSLAVSECFQEQLVDKLMTPVEKGCDLEVRVIAAYIHQCTAEAQEGFSSLYLFNLTSFLSVLLIYEKQSIRIAKCSLQ